MTHPSSDASRTHRMADLTWPEIAEAQRHAPVVVIPLGACEQHGPGLAMRTDTTRAEVVADLVARALDPSVLVTPVVPVGVSEHHMGFPGTLTLSSSSLRQVIGDLVDSLHRHGWRKIFVLTGHGGNGSTVDVAVAELRARFPDLHLAWSGITAMVPDLVTELAESGVRGHCCEIETSQALFSDPTLVYRDRLDRGSASVDDLDAAGRLSRSHPGVRFPQSYHALSATGALGDGRYASVDAGARLVRTAVERICAFLEGFIALPERQSATVNHSYHEEAR